LIANDFKAPLLGEPIKKSTAKNSTAVDHQNLTTGLIPSFVFVFQLRLLVSVSETEPKVWFGSPMWRRRLWF
jgi:hypothetical protein